MVGHTSLEEQVDADFTRAHRKALLRRTKTRLQRGNASIGPLCFDDLRKIPGALGSIYRGMRTVPVIQIGGSLGRCSEFDRDFMPAKESVEERWKQIDRAFHRGKELPPVSLYEAGGFYFVLDGHHRLSVAHYHGVEWIDAYVTEFDAGGGGVWNERRDRGEWPDRGVKREGPRMYDLMSLELAKQRREELLREAEMNHQAKALRAARKGREGRKSELIWEIEKHAGGLLKRLRKTWREVGG